MAAGVAARLAHKLVAISDIRELRNGKRLDALRTENAVALERLI